MKSSSSVTLKTHVRIDGKVGSSSYIWLEDEILIDGKVDSSGKVTLRDGVRVEGKVDASGSVEYVSSSSSFLPAAQSLHPFLYLVRSLPSLTV